MHRSAPFRSPHPSHRLHTLDQRPSASGADRSSINLFIVEAGTTTPPLGGGHTTTPATSFPSADAPQPAQAGGDAVEAVTRRIHYACVLLLHWVADSPTPSWKRAELHEDCVVVLGFGSLVCVEITRSCSLQSWLPPLKEVRMEVLFAGCTYDPMSTRPTGTYVIVLPPRGRQCY